MKIKDLHKIERPREKMEKYGLGKLTDAELLAILLRTGTKDLNVVDLSKKILRKFKNKEISKVSLNELKGIHGLGSAKACEIMACFELGRRMLKNKKAILCIKPEEAADQRYFLNAGRYAEVADKKEEEYDFKERLSEYHQELQGLTKEAHVLEDKINHNLGELLKN